MRIDSNLAYAIRSFEDEQQPVKQPEIKKVEKSKTVPKKKGSLKLVLGMFYALLLCSCLIYGKVQLTEANSILQDKTQELMEVESESTRLNLSLESVMSLKNIEEQAKTQIGLGEANHSQIEYIVSAHQNKAEVAEKDDGFTSMIGDFFQQIKEYIFG